MSACKPPFVRPDGRPVVLAHRGGSLERPENTLVAFEHGIRYADWCELDTIYAKDGAVVIHDDRLERTTGVVGAVGDLTVAQLQAIAAGKPRPSQEAAEALRREKLVAPDFNDLYAAATIPSLRQALSVASARFMIEMKGGDVEKLAVAVVDEVAATAMSERVAIASFESAYLRAVHRLRPELPLVAIVETPAALRAFEDLPLRVIAAEVTLAEKLVRTKPADVALWVWTVISLRQAEHLIGLGVEGLITDIPQALSAILPKALDMA